LGGSLARRRRKRSAISCLPVAAEIQELESRALLTVTFHGGALLANVEAQAVYLGAGWNGAQAHGQSVALDQFVGTIVQSGYMDMLHLAGYNVNRGSASAGVVDNISIKRTVTDAQIQVDLQALINSHQVQPPDSNRLYIVYVQPGIVVRAPGLGSSSTTFLGYHGAFGGRTASGTPIDIHYAVIPFPGKPNFSPTSQGFAATMDELTSVSSHELAESVTDPNVGYKTLGWYDDQLNGEIGDLTTLNTVMNGYVVQDVVDQNDQPISPAHPVNGARPLIHQHG
jgi:hypothetical protein